MPISANFGKICPNISLWIASAGIKHFLDQGMFEFFLGGEWLAWKLYAFSGQRVVLPELRNNNACGLAPTLTLSNMESEDKHGKHPGGSRVKTLGKLIIFCNLKSM